MYATGGYLTFNLQGINIPATEDKKIVIEGLFEVAEASVRLSKPVFLQNISRSSNRYGVVSGGVFTQFMYDSEKNIYYCTLSGNFNNQYHINVTEEGVYSSDYQVE